jgi:hypothetical protein
MTSTGFGGLSAEKLSKQNVPVDDHHLPGAGDTDLLPL